MPEHNQFGFCEGVVAADNFLSSVTVAAAKLGVKEVFGYHDIVHNATVRNEHEARGVEFVQSIDDVPDGKIVVGSAHGSSPEVPYSVRLRGGLFFDGACPLVTHTHRAVQQARQRDERVLYLLSGDPERTTKVHDEVVGTVGHMDYATDSDGGIIDEPVRRSFLELSDDPNDVERLLDDQARYRIVGQTTLLASRVMEFREQLAGAIKTNQPDASVKRVDRRDVCFAVEDRQEGVRVLLSKKPKTVVVVTDPNSKNGMGYAKLATDTAAEQDLQTQVLTVATAQELDELEVDYPVAVTASASTADTDTKEVVSRLGGDLNKVPLSRASFTLKNSQEGQIEAAIKDWLEREK